MKNKLKKLIVIFLSVILLLPSYSFAEENDSALVQMQEGVKEELAQKEFPKAIAIEAGLLNAMDMLPENTDFTSQITREEAAVLAVKMLAKDELAESYSYASYFDDVSVYSKNVGYINVAVLEGFFSGRGEKTFDPNSPITYAEFCKLMVTATGYGIAAERNGGYPDGYIKIALQLKIAKAVPANTLVTWGDAVKMAYDTMQANVLVFDILGSNDKDEISKTSKRNILNVYHHMFFSKGQITGTPLCRLFGVGASRELKSGEIEIDGNLYNYDEIKNPYLDRRIGFNVEYFYRELSNGNNELVYTYIKEAQTIELMSYEIREVYGFDRGENGNGYIKYFIDDVNEQKNKNKKVTLDKNLSLILNNETIPRPTNAMLFPSCGKVVLIDSDNNNIYDVAIVTEYTTQIVDVVSIYDKHIFFKNNPTKPLALNPAYNNVEYDIMQDGEYISLNKLGEGDVIGIIESKRDDKTYYLIELFSSHIEGYVNSISDDFVEIDGVDYRVSDDFEISEIKLGYKYKLYFDFADELFYAEKIEENYDYQYVLIDAGKTQGLNGYVQLKVCYAPGSQSKKIQILDCAERVNINGTMKKGSEILNALKLTETEKAKFTDEFKNASAKFVFPGVYEFLRPLKWVEFDAEGKVKLIETSDMSSDIKIRIYEGSGPYNEAFGEHKISYKTQIFYIPYTMNDDDWMYSELGKIKFGSSHWTLTWGSDSEGLPEAVFLWHFQTSSNPDFLIDYNRPMLIKNTKVVYDKNEDASLYKIDTLNIGAAYTYYQDSRTPNGAKFMDLKPGDVIFAGLAVEKSDNASKISSILNGDMWNVEKVIRLDDKNLSFYKSTNNMYGRVKTIRTEPRLNKCVINIDLGVDNQGNEITQSYDIIGVPIYYFDRGENVASVATYAAIRSAEVYGEDGASNIFVCLDEEFDPNMIVVVGEK